MPDWQEGDALPGCGHWLQEDHLEVPHLQCEISDVQAY